MSVTVRRAASADADAICTVVEAQLEPEDAAEARYTLQGPLARADQWLVAEVDGSVAAFCCGCPCDLRIGSVTMPALNVEFVATAEGHEGRGLQRALFEALPGAFPDALVHLITGIPYFYRRLGYEYAIPIPDRFEADRPALPDGWTTRVATADDIPLLMSLQAEVQAHADVALTHTTDQWAWLVPSPNYTIAIAEGPDGPAMARGYRGDPDTSWVMEVAAPSEAGAAAAIHGAAEGFDRVAVMDRPADPADLAGSLGGDRHPSRYAYYLKVVDVPAVLDGLRPELDGRLAASGLEPPDTLKLDLYTSWVDLPVVDGAFGPPEVGRRGGFEADRIGVPPDLVAHLLLGPLGGTAMDDRHADVRTRERAALFGALFPPLVADVHSWIVP
ncbi:MAG: GNAT family N-acetyltransferase [Acidimicrobiia bacterium]